MGTIRKTEAGANLRRWFKEDWKTRGGDDDYSGGESTFRPTKKVSSKTPSTWSELTEEEKDAAANEKNTKGRVTKYKKAKHGGGLQGCGCPYGMEIGPNNVL